MVILTSIDFEILPACVGVLGSCSFADAPASDMKMYEYVRKFVFKLQADTEVVTAGARGVDSYAEDAAYLKKMRTVVYDKKSGVKPSEDTEEDIEKRHANVLQHVYRQEGILVVFTNEKNPDEMRNIIHKAQKLGVPVIEGIFTKRGNLCHWRVN